MRWWSRWGYVAMLVVALWPVMGYGQSSTSFTFHSGATSVVNGNVMSAANFSTIVVQVEGTFVGTVQFEKKTKDAAGYVAVQCTNANDRSVVSTTTSEAGYWECPGGAYLFRVPVTARTSGTIKVTGMGTTAVAGRGAGGVGVASWPWNTSDPDINTADGLVNAIGILGASGDGRLTYLDPITGPQSVDKCGGVVNGCNYYRQLAAGKKAGYKDSAGNIDFEYDEATGAITVASIDCTSASVTCTVVDERHYAVASCQGSTPSTIFDTPPSVFPQAVCDTGANNQKAYLAFDAATDESLHDQWILPAGFVSVTVYFRWKAAATSGAVGWCAQLVRVATTSDPAFPAQASGNCVSDTASGTTLVENSATIANVTCTSCVAGDHVYVRISRDADGSAVTDSMTGDALLLMYGRAFVVAM